MTDIMKLADDYARAYMSFGESAARAALQLAIEALQAEAEQVKGFWKEAQLRNRNLLEENNDLAFLADQYKAERDALQAKLDELAKQEPIGEVVQGLGPRLYRIEDRTKWGMKLYAAPKALEPLTDDFLQSNDYHLLHRFIETTEDNEGYDITKTEIKRLADLGVVQSHGFGRYSVTMFGYWVHERFWEQNPSLPLKTNSDRDAEAAHGITKGTP